MPMVNSTAKGQIVIPKEIRKELGIKPGQRLAIKVVDDHAEIRPLPENPIEYLCGIFKDYKGSLAEELSKEKQEDLRYEEKKITGLIRAAHVSKTRKGI